MDGGRRAQPPKDPSASGKKTGKPRAADLGRALRSVYDDTLREPVPDEFLDIIGKLT